MTYPSTTARKRAKGPVGHWALAGAMLAVLVGCIYDVNRRLPDFARQDLAMSLGVAVGFSVVIALVAWLVAYFVLVRRSAPERGMPYFLVLFFFAVIIEGGAAVTLVAEQQKAQTRTAAQEIEATISALKSPGSARIDTRPKAHGDAGEIERLTKVYYANLQSDRNAYLAELKAVGVIDALKPEHIAKDRTLRATRAGLAQGKAIVKKYRARYHDRRTEARASIVASALSPAAKSSTLAGFDQALAGGDQADRVWDIEDAYLAQIDATLADLQRTQGLWRVRGRQILFSDEGALQVYNQHIANLKTLGQQEQALRDRATQQGLEQIRNAAE